MKIINYHNLENTNDQNNKYATANIEKTIVCMQQICGTDKWGMTQTKIFLYKNDKSLFKEWIQSTLQMRLKLFNEIMPFLK